MRHDNTTTMVKEKSRNKNINNPEILTMVEEWDSQEHLDANLNTAFFKKTAAKLNKMYTKETEMNIYVQVL